MGMPPGALLLAACAAFCALIAGAILWSGSGRTRWLLAGACAASAVWAALAAGAERMSGLLDIMRCVVWLGLLLHLHGRGSGRRAVLARRFAWLAACAVPLAILSSPDLEFGLPAPLSQAVTLAGRMGLPLLLVLVAENLLRNATDAERWHVNLACIVVGSLASLDIVAYAAAALAYDGTLGLVQARALLAAVAAPLLLVAAIRDRRLRRRISFSRQAVFHGATLLFGGAFLAGVGMTGGLLRRTNLAWGLQVQVSLLAAGMMTVAVALASQSVRSRIHRAIVDNLFRVRFDYRREWMRCITTLFDSGQATAQERSPERTPGLLHAIQAIANAVDSPGGVLLLQQDASVPAAAPQLRWAASWNRPDTALFLPAGHALFTQVKGGTWIAEMASWPAHDDGAAELQAAFGPLWLAVPLARPGGLLGIVLLAPPRAPFPLDREVCDLLRALGRNVALFLAERLAAEQIVASRQLHDYAKRFAFVAHDVKTVSAQLRLLLSNAEHHMDNPAFQQDLLSTVAAAAGRIDTLIARLRQPDARAAKDEPGDEQAGIDPAARLRALVSGTTHPLRLDTAAWDADPALADMAAGPFDSAVMHLLDNAIEASAPGVPVQLRVRRDGIRAVVEITDLGPGMTPAFIRDELFRPLHSAKCGGNGIGAWQARDLVHSAGGELAVASRPGLGTTMRLVLPIAPTAPPDALPGVRIDVPWTTGQELCSQ